LLLGLLGDASIAVTSVLENQQGPLAQETHGRFAESVRVRKQRERFYLTDGMIYQHHPFLINSRKTSCYVAKETAFADVVRGFNEFYANRCCKFYP